VIYDPYGSQLAPDFDVSGDGVISIKAADVWLTCRYGTSPLIRIWIGKQQGLVNVLFFGLYELYICFAGLCGKIGHLPTPEQLEIKKVRV